MTNRPLICVASLFLLVLSRVAFAHPGHGGGLLHGLFHPLGGLDHLLAALAVGVWSAQQSAKRVLGLPLAFVAALLAGGVLGSSGIAFPYLESWIALSVIFLGAAIGLSGRVTWHYAVPSVLFFGTVHGNAHGAEMPASQSLLFYGAGFAGATLLLHVLGIIAVRIMNKVSSETVAAFALRTAGVAVFCCGAGMVAGLI